MIGDVRRTKNSLLDADTSSRERLEVITLSKEQIIADCKANPNRTEFFSHVKEIREVKSVDELAAFLASGKWFAICASAGQKEGDYLFSLVRVDD